MKGKQQAILAKDFLTAYIRIINLKTRQLTLEIDRCNASRVGHQVQKEDSHCKSLDRIDKMLSTNRCMLKTTTIFKNKFHYQTRDDYIFEPNIQLMVEKKLYIFPSFSK